MMVSQCSELELNIFRETTLSKSASINLHMGSKLAKVFNPMIPLIHNPFQALNLKEIIFWMI